MPSFQHFQRQAEQSPQRQKYSNDVLSLSVILQYAESAKKQNFDALCRVQPLVKSYRDKVDGVSKAMRQAESSLVGETDVPPSYTAAYALVEESFSTHIAALDEWASSLTNKNAPQSEQAMIKVQQSGERLETALQNLTV